LERWNWHFRPTSSAFQQRFASYPPFADHFDRRPLLIIGGFV
jgi:hypothetical protein